MAYYNDGGFGNNQFQPFGTPGATGGYFGTMPVGGGAFQSPFGQDYYDSAGSNGNVGLEQFLKAQNGGNTNSSRYANWLRQRGQTLYTQYGADQGQDPSLKWSDWLTKNQDTLQGQYAGQNPYDKGEQGQRKLQWL